MTANGKNTVLHRGEGLQIVVGLGKSGLAVVNHLHALGYQVAVTDSGYPNLAKQLPNNVMTYFGGIDSELLTTASRIIISPGIDPLLPVFDGVRAHHIAMVSDIQLFHEICQQKNIPIIAITGSNAKSTVTTLVGKMAENMGKKVGVGGNLGLPALDLLRDPIDLAVLELSSFQLQTTTQLSAQVAVVLNMSPDHLDRHGDMLGYHREKHRIFQGAKSIVVNRDDPLSRPLVADDIPRISFGASAPDINQYGILTDSDGEMWLARGSQRLLHEKDVPIKGQHNLINALSALAIGELAGFSPDSMLNTIKQFVGLPHRCEFVKTLSIANHKLDCYDDSKGTNIGSTLAAVCGLGNVYQPKGKKLALILGGVGKEQQFFDLANPLTKFVSYVYLIGKDSKKIADDLQSAKLGENVVLHHCQTLQNAFNQAVVDSERDANVGALLLSPACASFDQFTDYVQRGQAFKDLVNDFK
ncbi:UDP-N-acetylmuramoyl-L-alanyl-D-glutamate synthetase [Moraxella macacae 0408225]|uniref:UDP-N-acetylmuramoylalanine--D-glutamate ligase n=1 Tax=Moraxella macacae 0408225 TaxID=1230338 RepID=L2F8Z8_9GAMM|nr:UDP-N-acetylmuramoyl-L-alanine--D-glutamate ligase [Moraxella macacae]ELA09534.1 UDP-N-acetylmuramoyl-L-alanyl-D-glutamate synthetase [Moraxella macacae 0408225]